MRSNAAPRGILGDFTNSNLYSLLWPCTKRAVDAARRLLYLAALPSEVACSTLSEATSLCERIQGDLRSLFSRRDTPLDDDISSTAPNPKQALPSPTPAHALAASAADSARHQGMESPSSTAHGSAITLAVDSGCTWHLHHRRDQLQNLRPCNDSIQGIGGVSRRCLEMGDLEISTLDENGRQSSIKLTNVRLAPDVDIALISVSQLIGANFEVMLGTPPHLRSPSGDTLPLHMVNGLYLLKGNAAPSSARHEATEINVTHAVAFGSARDPHSTSHIKALPPDEAARHMCRRLHLGVGKMRALPTITADVPSNLGKARTSTSPYMTTANATKRSHVQARYKESQPGRLVHLDIAGPLLESRIGRFRYLMLLIDDSSRFRVAIPMRTREEASAKIRGFVSRFNARAPPGGASHVSARSYRTEPRSSYPTKCKSTSMTTAPTRRRVLQGYTLSTGAPNAAYLRSSKLSVLNSSSLTPLAPFGPSRLLPRWTS